MTRIEHVNQYSNVKWRLNNLYSCITDAGKQVPFRMNDAQTEFYDNLWYFNLALKARQLGFTTLIDIMALDSALFNDTYSAGICAHTREDVEKIFEKKIKMPYDALPEGLRQARRADTDSAKKLKFNNGSSIEVGTSLRSGTYQFAHISEFGKICAKYPDKAKELVTGTFETVHPGSMLFVESTAEGRNGYFYKYVVAAQKRQQQGKKLNKLQFKLHFFPWFLKKSNVLDPETVVITKNHDMYFDKLERELDVTLSAEQRAWYVTKQASLMDDMKREHPSTVEEAFEAAIEGAYLAKQMEFLRSNGRIGVVPHDPAYPVNTGWDFGLSDRMCIWFHQFIGMQHRLIGYMSGTDDDVLYYWREMQRLPYMWGEHCLPHDAGARRIGSARSADENPRTLEQILSDAGMRNIRVVPRIDDKYSAINETRLFLPKLWIDEKACADGITSLDGFRREYDERLAEFKNKPLHDWAMHGYDALETMARGFTEKIEGATSKRRKRNRSAMTA
jgi:hypothetical protein